MVSTPFLPWVAVTILHVSKSEDWNNPFQIVKVDNEGTVVMAGPQAAPGAQQYLRGSPVDLTGWQLRCIVEPEFGFSSPITTFVSRSANSAPDSISVDDAIKGFGRFICLSSRLSALPVGEWRFRMVRTKGLLTRNVSRGPFFVHP